MAHISEIIDAYRNKGEVLPDNVKIVIDSTTAPTRERYNNAVIDALGGLENLPQWIEGAEVYDNPALPSMKVFLDKLGIHDGDPKKPGSKTAIEKVIDGYKHNWKDWKKTIVNDNRLGERGWEFFKNLWKRAVADKAVQDTKKNRYDTIHDGSVAGFLARAIAPRMTEHLANTGDFSGKDLGLDIGENLLMMVPGTGFAKLGSKIVPSKLLNAGRSAIDYLKSANSPVLTGAGYLVGAVPNTVGNTVVPLVSEIADDIAYDPGEGMDDRADFSAGDVAIGGAINQAVNRGLIRSIAPYIDRYSGDLKSVGAKKLRNFFEALGKSRSSLGEDYANKIRNAVKEPVIRAFPEGDRITVGEWEALKNGQNIIPEGQSLEEFFDNVTAERLLDLIDNGTLTVRDAQTIAGKVAKRQAKKEKFLKTAEASYRADAVDAALAGEFDDATGLLKKAEDLNKLRSSNKTLEGASTSDIIRGTAYTGDVANGNAIQPEHARQMFMENPELFNYAYWKNASKLDKLGNAINQAAPSLIINKAGKSKYAPEITQVFKDSIEKDRQETKKKSNKSQVSKVISAKRADSSLTSEDERFLSDIANNPSILQYGYEDSRLNDQFKMWLLKGGNDLLRGTDAFRPVWDVE
jgi:hypothetical protein